MIDSNVKQKDDEMEKIYEKYQSLCTATPYTKCSIL